MRDSQPKTIYLRDYEAPPFLVDDIRLHVELYDDHATVSSELLLRRRPGADPTTPLTLDGVDLELLEVQLDGRCLREQDYLLGSDTLTLHDVPGRVRLTTVSRVYPQENTSLEGLYRSRGLFCTQCEAEGFRKITWFPDRPDSMARYRVTIDADAQACPVLLSNGNEVHREALPGGRHRAVWEDPFPKPSYLFALVAGDLDHIEDRFETVSGRVVTLRIHAEARDLDKCGHAMEALKASMRWDETRFGREYDLDVFNIVAVDDFNMGAMENKSLNIFNTSCVLASPDTTTDAGFLNIEAIVAHEYFHNWSGNRVTCRDWFQLSLKEGFTVYRDAEFSSDRGSRDVKRVQDAQFLRTAQFAEDAGPLAHPVRPDSFIEISNFYTLTVYEKGAEVVRMLHTLLGDEAFRAGCDLYFERHDGQAVTCDDFLAAMAEASGRDLRQFGLWYSQAGTPVVDVQDRWDEAAGRYTLRLRQHCPATPGQPHKAPMHIPIRIGLLGAEGELPVAFAGEAAAGEPVFDRVLELRDEETEYHFAGLAERPVPSLLRAFSAPVRLRYDYGTADLATLAARDSDGYVRWDACQRLMIGAIDRAAVHPADAGPGELLGAELVSAAAALLDDTRSDPAIIAEMLKLPSEAFLIEQAARRGGADPIAIHAARERVQQALGQTLLPAFEAARSRTRVTEDYRPEGAQMARRALANVCLAYLVAGARERGLSEAEAQYHRADNLTDRLVALRLLATEGDEGLAGSVLEDFYGRWQHETLAVNQWLQVQASVQRSGAVTRVRSLMAHPAFDLRNPNKVRAVVGVFAQLNTTGFHAADGSGYRLLGETVATLDGRNPQLASRLLTPLTAWRNFPSRAHAMRAELERLAAREQLSRDVYEVVTKALATEEAQDSAG